MDFNDLTRLTESKKLLFIEDDETVRSSGLSLFQELFQETVVAVDGQDGWEKFQADDFDLIITDVNMPNMDGITLLKNIRAVDSKIAVIMLTAHNDMKYILGASENRTSGYIIKPLTLDSLGEALLKIESSV